MKEDNGKKITRNRMTHEQVRAEALQEAEALVRERGDKYWEMAPMFAETRDYKAAADFQQQAVHYFMAADIIKNLMEDEG